MQKVDEQTKTIKVNRGDVLNLHLTADMTDGTKYTFQNGDKVIFAVYEKNKLQEPAVIFKQINIAEASQSVTINLTSQETKIGEIKNKEVEYWYEVELNGQYTLIGYDDVPDEKGEKAKKFMLYPEGSRIE